VLVLVLVALSVSKAISLPIDDLFRHATPIFIVIVGAAMCYLVAKRV
jgi:hypothetical protein